MRLSGLKNPNFGKPKPAQNPRTTEGMVIKMEINIRRAQLRDCADLQRLLLQIDNQHAQSRPDLFRQDAVKYDESACLRILADEKRPVFVAADAGERVCGYAFCEVLQYKNHAVLRDCRTLYLDDLCVDESCRRQGIGEKLMAAVMAYARENGAYNVDLNVWEFNENAIRFYEKNGFTTQRRKMEVIL